MQSENTVGPGGVPVQGMRSDNAIHLTLSKEQFYQGSNSIYSPIKLSKLI